MVGLDSGVSSTKQDTIKIVLEEDQQTKVTTNQNENPYEKNGRRSTRMRTESTRLARYDIFLDQAIDADGDFIEEVMIMDESKSIGLD